MGVTAKPITIRRASPADAFLLTDIAHAAKRHWGYPELWIEAWKPALTITPEFISSNEVYVACIDSSIAGFSALVSADGKTWLEHLWVSPTQIGTGLGNALFRHAASIAAANGAQSIEIESDPNAEGFYKRMGAERVGEVESEIEGEKRVLPLLVFDLS